MKKILSLLILLVLVFTASAGATMYYVSPTGDDGLDGLSVGNAWLSIDRGDQLGILLPGDTVNVLPGTYPLASSATFTQSGLSGNPIVYRSFGMTKSTFDGGGGGFPIFDVTGSYITFENLQVFNSADNGLEVSGANVVIYGCAISNINTYGIYLTSGADSTRVLNNTFYNASNVCVYSVASVRSARIINNIMDSATNGIWGHGDNVAAHNNMWNVSSPYVGGIADSAGGISVDPQFTNPGLNDFTLQSSSLCINAGMDLGYPYIGSAPDMGAYEYQPPGGNVYWVSPTGNDGNTGLDSSQAWASIDRGEQLSLLLPGDTVNILPGVYSPTALYDLSTAGTAPFPITYRKFGTGSAIIDCSGHTDNAFDFTAPHISLQGLEIANGAMKGIDIQADSCTVIRCYIHDVNDEGINSNKRGLRFERNVIARTGKEAIIVNGEDCVTNYNTIFYPNAPGIHYKGGVTDGRIFNNIVVGANEGIRGNGTVIAGFNNLWDNTQDYTNGIADSAGGLFVDPLFSDTSVQDYRLLPTSPCVDSALDLGGSFGGTGPDMGAFELTFDHYWVSPTGNDLNDGLDSTTAWATVDNGEPYFLIGPGDTVNVMAGTYAVTSTVTLDASGTLPLPVVYRQFDEYDAIIDHGNASDTIVSLAGDYVHFDGLTVQNGTTDGIEVVGDHVEVKNCLVHHCGLQAIDVQGDKNLVLKNIACDGGWGGIVIRSTADNTLIYGNTIHQFPMTGIWISPSAPTTRAFNNIVARSGDGIDGPAGAVLGFNNTWSIVGQHYAGSAVDSAGGISADPMFTDTAAYDFSLTAGSPCIDSGLYVGYPFQGSAPDMGAIEFSPAVNQAPVISPIGPRTITEGDSLSVAAKGSDPNGDAMTLTVENIPANASFVDHGDSTGTFTFVPDYTQAGVYNVLFIVSDGSLSDSETVVITVDPAPISYIEVQPSTWSQEILSQKQFTVIGYDAGADPVSTLTDSVAWTTTDAAGTVTTGGLYTAGDVISPPDYFVRAEYQGSIADSATVTLLAGTVVTSIEIEWFGGTAIGDTSLTTDNDTSVVHCRMYNAADSLLGDTSAAWSVIGLDSIGTLTPANGDTSILTLATPGQGYIVAILDTFIDTSGMITCVAGEPVNVVISPDSITVTTDTTVDFSTTSFDADGNPSNPQVVPTFFLTDSIGSITSPTGLFTPTTVGTGRVYCLGSGLEDTTETITVLAGLAQRLEISPDTATISADSTRDFTVTAYDGYDNVTSPGTITWDALGGIGTINGGGTFDAASVGAGSVTAQSSLGPVDTSGTINVVAGDLATLQVTPQTIAVGLGDTVQFSATGYDADSNTAATGVITWDLIGRIGTIDSTGRLIATAPGSGRVAALSSLAVSDTTDIIDVEELLFSTLPIGNSVAYPNAITPAILSFHIQNYYQSEKAFSGIAVREVVLGAGNPAELRSNVDSLYLYIDADADSLLSGADSLLSAELFDGLSTLLAFDSLAIETGTGATFFVAARTAQYPHDGDTLDCYIRPGADIATTDGTTVQGPDSANSLGYLTFDGMVAEQLNLNGSGVETILPADTGYHLLTITIPANGYAVDTLTGLTLNNLGTATDHDLDSLLLFADDGDSVPELVSDDLRIGRLVYTGNTWAISGLTAELSGPENRFYVCGFVSEYPTNGVTLNFEIQTGSIQVRSGNDGPLDQTLVSPDTISVASIESFDIVSVSGGDATLYPGSQSGAMLDILMTNGYASTISLDSLLITASTFPGDDATQTELDSQFDSLALYMRKLNGEDSLLATATVVAGEAVFVLSGVEIPATGGQLELITTAFLNTINAKNGNTLALSIQSTGDIYISPSVTANADFPLINSSEFVVDAFPAAAVVVNPVAAGSFFGGQSNLLAADFVLPGNGYALAQLSSIRLMNTGTFDDNDATLSIRLVSDTSAALVNELSSIIGEFDYAGSYWILSSLTLSVPASGTRVYVVVDVANDQTDGGTFRLSIPTGGLIYKTGLIGPDDAPVTNPFEQLVFPSNRITAISVPAITEAILPGSLNNDILSFALYNGYLDQERDVQSITFTNLSQGAFDEDLADYSLGQVSLYFDENRNRLFDDDALLSSGYFEDGLLTLNGAETALPPESLSYFFVVADIPLDVRDGDSLAVGIARAADIRLSQTSVVNGDLPLTDGRYHIIDGSVADQYTVLPLTPQSLSPGDTSITLFALSPALNGYVADTLETLALENALSADTSDFENLTLWLDTNDDSLWQATDQLLGSFSYSDDTWSVTGLSLELTDTAPVLMILGDVTLTATPDAAFRGEIPIFGGNYASGNDGPTDAPLYGSGTFTVSSSGLRIAFGPMDQTVSEVQPIVVRTTVVNLLPTAMNDVYGEVVNITDSSLVSLDSALSGPVTIPAGGSTEFVYFFDAVAAGQVSFQTRAIAPLIPDSSVIITTDNIDIQNVPDQFGIELVNSIPTSVTRGQTNVFPLSLRIVHPETTPDYAALRLDSLRIQVRNGAALPLSASQVFSRVVLASGYTNLAILETVPDSSSLLLEFSEPMIVSPGVVRQFVLLVDIDSIAPADEFSITIADPAAIPALDNNSLLAVAADSNVSFPLATATCRIDDPSQQLAVASLALPGNTLNEGQINAPLIRMQLRHPGVSGSSQIQLTDLSILIHDSLGVDVPASALFSSMRLTSDGIPVGSISGAALESSHVTIPLFSPVTLNPDESRILDVEVSILPFPTSRHTQISVPDSTYFTVRDISSGSLVDAATDTAALATGSVFPVNSSMTLFKRPAEGLTVCLGSTLPTSVAGGRTDLSLMDYDFYYPANDDHSSARLQTLYIYVTDSLDHLLDPDLLFDRIGYRVDGGTITYMSFVETATGALVVRLTYGGLTVDPGDTVNVEIIADLEASIPIDHFRLAIEEIESIDIIDATDTVRQVLPTVDLSCSNGVPYNSIVTSIYMAAGRPRVSLSELPAQIGFKGQTGVTLLTGELDYPALGLEGDITFSRVAGTFTTRTGTGVSLHDAGTIVSAVHLLIDGTPVATDSVLSGSDLIFDLPTPLTIHRTELQDWSLRCDIRTDAAVGNYFVEFSDSSFMTFDDVNLGQPVYATLAEGQYPLKSAELVVSEASLESSFVNYPNPFFPSRGDMTTIAYVLANDARVDIDIFSITGELVLSVVQNADRAAGPHQEDQWSGDNKKGNEVMSGTYFCRITAKYTDGQTEVYRRKIAVIR